MGVGLTASATFVALNNYFVKRRGQAIGFSLAGTAFGMMLMPQAVTLLLDNYGFRGKLPSATWNQWIWAWTELLAAILILGAFAANSLVGSVLLQPAKWHYIPEEQNLEEGEYKQVIYWIQIIRFWGLLKSYFFTLLQRIHFFFASSEVTKWEWRVNRMK